MPSPLPHGSKGNEKSFFGNPADPTQLFETGGFAPVLHRLQSRLVQPADTSPDRIELVTLRTFSTHMEADMAASLLDAFGVECTTSADDCSGQRAHMSNSSGVRLIVRSDDLSRAVQILANESEG